MCMHYWIIGSGLQCECKLCGAKKDLSEPRINLTPMQKKTINRLGKSEYYMNSGYNIEKNEYVW